MTASATSLSGSIAAWRGQRCSAAWPFRRRLRHRLRSAADRVLQLLEEALGVRAFLAGLGIAEGFEDLALPGGKPGRGLDLDLDHHVPMAAAVHRRHAGAALADLLARLDSRRDPDFVALLVEPRHLDAAAERGGGETDRAAREQGGAIALEDRVPGKMDEDVEVAGRAAAHTRFAFAGETDPCALVHPGRDVDRQGLASLDPALAAAGGAGIGDRLADAAALRAGLLDHEEALARPDLAAAAAHRAGLGRSAGLGPRAAARLAGRGGVDLKLDLAAVEGVLELDLEVVAKVGAAPHVAAAAALLGATHELAEDIVENVGEGTEVLRPAIASEAVLALEGGVTEAVVGGALLRILEAFIGLAQSLELRLRLGAAAVSVGMALHRQLAIGRLDRRRIGGPLDLQQLVIIGLNHDGPDPPSPRRSPGSR